MGIAGLTARAKHAVVRSGPYRNLSGKYRKCPEHCGAVDDPGAPVHTWMVDYSEVETTPDQLRIEGVLEGLVAAAGHDLAVLHVGVGNSGLAQRFVGRVGRLEGATVSERELAHAASLDLDGYRVRLANKYAPTFGDLFEPGFDVIVDNNPTSFACCRAHVDGMFRAYASLLGPLGQVLTDRTGLGWTVGNPRWAVTPRDLRRLCEPHGMTVEPVTRQVLAIRRAG